ncbi:glycoside hydrolase superfamily [Xylariaceae sp. FL1019]|nr:glycoside hydrolase superfamily [Xylariaceae sp. FL1019]
MSRPYSYDSDPDEHAPLDHQQLNSSFSYPPQHGSHTSPQRYPQSRAYNNEHHYYQDDASAPYQDQSPRRQPVSNLPGTHPDSHFARLRQNRAQAADSNRNSVTEAEALGVGASALTRPVPPPHQTSVERTWGHQAQPSITPGADNFSEAAAGGIPGLAMSVAERNARESGLEAMRATEAYQRQQPQRPYPQVYQRDQPQYSPDDELHNNSYHQNYDAPQGYSGNSAQSPYDHGHGSANSLAGVPAAGYAYSGSGYDNSVRSVNSSHHSDPFGDPQLAYGQRMDPRFGHFNPNDIDDDGDDGLDYRRSQRNSMLSLGGSGNRNASSAAAAGTAGAAATGGVLGGILGRNRNSSVNPNYDPVQNPSTSFAGANQNDFELGNQNEKPSAWISKQSSSRKKWSWIIAIIVFLVIAGAVVGGVVGSMFAGKKSNSGGSSGAGGDNGGGESAEEDTNKNGDLDISSSQIQALLNNKNLHKVFPAVDYTPIGAQYPECLTYPPSQNNVTRDMAVLSQLTNKIRLYGTDCNQTAMTLHAINQLGMQDDIKIWMGVWLEKNETTNKRQLGQMWQTLDEYGDGPFEGLIVGNEVLFREDLTLKELATQLDDVRQNLTKHGWDLPVATSDLGDNWTEDLAQYSDYIMGNVHPFFAGEPADNAANWAWTFWHNKAEPFFKSDSNKNVISEIGWPTQGGTDCGSDEVLKCDNGAVATIDGLNTVLDTWVCQALANGTNYFWFEMFDEPWKIKYNNGTQNWEDHWGILDVDRNLKEGVTIPDCGGKTVS